MKQILKLFLIAITICAGSSEMSALNFKPFLANTFEPRVGAMYEFADRKLRLDIGTSLDLASFDFDDNSKLSVGADFFTYSRLRSEGHLKFPVETADYFFGVNAAYTVDNYALRLRVAHISSHLIDGMADSITFSQEPFVYSREFVDLAFAYNIKNLRFYAGLNILFSTQPNNFLALHPQLGFDYSYPLTSLLDIVAGYDFKFVGINSNFHPVHSMQAGLKINTSNDVAVFLGVFGYHGKSIHGMFYNDKDDYLGFGLQLLF